MQSKVTVVGDGCLDPCEALFGVSCDQLEWDYLKASNTGAHDRFGSSIALSGDTLAVGALWEDGAVTDGDVDQSSDSAPRSGAVYVFVRSDGVWSQQAYLKASNADAHDQFGVSVALSGDTLVVGAWLEDSAAKGVNGDQTSNTSSGSGAVYVFTRSGEAWSQQAYVKASNTGAHDFFGCSVALSGDTLAVGAYGEDGCGTGVNGDQNLNGCGHVGAAYVFTRSGVEWTQQAYLKASNLHAAARFGASVALSGDTLAVSAPGDSSGATGVNAEQFSNSALESGAVYVFTRSVGTWSQQAYVKASNTDEDDWFGSSVALSGDTLVVGAPGEDSAATGVNGDQGNCVPVALTGDTRAVVAPGEASTAINVNVDPISDCTPNVGAVYVFTRSGCVWSQEAYLKASNESSQFGCSVALSGDALAVGAVGERSTAMGVNGDQNATGASLSGAVYQFTRNGDVWSQQVYLKASNTDANDRFGSSVSLSGDTLAVGAFWEGSDATGVNGDQSSNDLVNAGAVYITRAP